MTDAPTQTEGFRMPAEWEPHTRTWMAWPCRAELWGHRMAYARAAYAAVAKAIARHEPVVMLAKAEDVESAQWACGQGVEVMAAAMDDSWVRDTGPIFVRDGAGRVEAVCFGFNGWGHKYDPISADQALAPDIAARAGVRWHRANMVLEGGSIGVDGEGTLITTEQCLLNRNRNPSLSRAEIEKTLAAELGVEAFIWLGEGIPNDEIDGHVDQLAAFVGPGRVATIGGKANADNIRRLKDARDAKGRAIEVIELPPAPQVLDDDGAPLSLSYANFYIANGVVVVPGFDSHHRDHEALAVLRDVFPDRAVVQVPTLVVGRGGGNIHCITQQQPLGSEASA